MVKNIRPIWNRIPIKVFCYRQEHWCESSRTELMACYSKSRATIGELLPEDDDDDALS